MQMVAAQRDEELRSAYRDDIALYQPHMLVFIDEAGTDRRDSLWRYGYSVRGKTPQSCRLLVRGERMLMVYWSMELLMAMSF